MFPSVSSPSSLMSLTSFSEGTGFLAELASKVMVLFSPPESIDPWSILNVVVKVTVPPT